MADIWTNRGWAPTFRRTFGVDETTEWHKLIVELSDIRLSLGRDEVTWKVKPSRNFSIGSLYKEFFKAAPRINLSGIWKAKIPAKIKIFLWQVARNRIPSGDQVHKLHGTGDGKCTWCGIEEDSDHILFCCIVERYV